MDWLNRVCASEMDRPVGRIVYTTVLDHAGRRRLRPDRHAAGGGSLPGRHRRRLRPARRRLAALPPARGRRRADARRDLGAGGGGPVGAAGPRRARAADDDDLSTEAFPYMAARSIEVGPVPALALRISYAGELGWELYVPTEHGRWLWDALSRPARRTGVAPVGTARLRLAADREGLSLRRRRHAHRAHAGRGGARLHGEPLQERVRRPRGGAARARGGAARKLCAWCWTTPTPRRSATSRCWPGSTRWAT